MAYKILPTKEFSKDFKKIDSQMQLRVKKKIEEVSDDLQDSSICTMSLKAPAGFGLASLGLFFLMTQKRKSFTLRIS